MKFQRVIHKVMFEPWLIVPSQHWAIQKLLVNRLAGIRSDDVIINTDEKADEPSYEVQDGIAIIEMSGTMGRRLSMLEKICGGVDVLDIEKLLRQATADPSVVGTLLDVSSPGGMHVGTPELADVTATANEVKPVWSFTGDLMASAAYFVSAAAGQIYASSSSSVGSIGAYLAVVDESEAYRDAGLKVELFSSGKYKAAGLPGLPLSDDQKAYFAAMVKESADGFKAFVRSHRPDVPDEAMEGQCFWADAALENGLIDAVATRDQAIADLRRFASLN